MKRFLFCIAIFTFICTSGFTQEIKYPNVAGAFYPDDQQELTQMIDKLLEAAHPEPIEGEIFALISPHAGYGYSGEVAAYGYKLIRNKPYKTVVVIGPSHQYGFDAVSVYPKGSFHTPLGDIEIDETFVQKLLGNGEEIIFQPRAFEKEHSLEVQLPFLQRSLSDFKIVPIVIGDCPFSTCKKLADLLQNAIGKRKDVLVIASTDLAHRFDYTETEVMDKITLTELEKMSPEDLYNQIREKKVELCGGFPVVTILLLSKQLGYNKLQVLKYTNSAEVTGKKEKGLWTVGYASAVIDKSDEGKGEIAMLNREQKKKLLALARNTIANYLKTKKPLSISETEPLFLKEMGVFVTLNKHGQLRGCIGNIVGKQPLYLTVRDMAIAAATEDPRFPAVTLPEMKDIEIEISVLSPLERIDSIDKIELGKHGVLIKKGFNSGVFLPQVATETGWSKEEFLSNLCAHKAGLPADAWRDKATEVYIFSAEVFSEKEK